MTRPFLTLGLAAPVMALLVCSLVLSSSSIGRHILSSLLLAFIGLSVFTLFAISLSSPSNYIQVDTLNAGLSILSMIGFGARLAWETTSSPDRKDRDVARRVLIGCIVPYGLVAIPFVVITYFTHTTYALMAFSIPLIILPFFIAAQALRRASFS